MPLTLVRQVFWATLLYLRATVVGFFDQETLVGGEHLSTEQPRRHGQRTSG